MSQKTLVILAAGMGSRYGGLKQLDPITPHGESILDFSIYDAIQAGFTKVIFIVRAEIIEQFKATYEAKLSPHIEVAYALQDTRDVPAPFLNPERVKPWGTGHALLSIKEMISEYFALINADDFYGREAFLAISQAFEENPEATSLQYMVGYPIQNTLSTHGTVSRGECQLDEQHFLQTVTERLAIEKQADSIVYLNEEGKPKELAPETIVSMNFWGFSPDIFAYTEKQFDTFLNQHHQNLKAEFLLPSLVNQAITEKVHQVKVLPTDADWFGVTYLKDKPWVMQEIQKRIANGTYPKQLWS